MKIRLLICIIGVMVITVSYTTYSLDLSRVGMIAVVTLNGKNCVRYGRRYIVSTSRTP
jgi:hypothetical protein